MNNTYEWVNHSSVIVMPNNTYERVNHSSFIVMPNNTYEWVNQSSIITWMSEWQLRRPPYPEGAAGHVDLPPGDDQRVFDRLAGDVHAEEGAVAVVRDLDVDREALRILPGQKQDSKRWIVDDANYSLMMFALMAERGGGRCKMWTFSYSSWKEWGRAFQPQHYQ